MGDNDPRFAVQILLKFREQVGRPGEHQAEESHGDGGEDGAGQAEVVVGDTLLDEIAHDDEDDELERCHLAELAFPEKAQQRVDDDKHHGGAKHDIHQGRTSS